MSRPVRMRDDVSTAPERRELLRSARASRPLPAEARARSNKRLDRMLVVPAAAGVLFWIKGVAAAGIGVIGVVAAVKGAPALLARVEPAPRPAHASAAPRAFERPAQAAPAAPQSSHAIDAPDVEVAPSAVAAAPFSPAATSTARARDCRAPPEASASAAAVDPLTREAAILEAARAMLERDPAGALARLDLHAATFPSGGLALERELLAVDALERLGRYREAQTRGTALLERSPGSIYEERVKALLDGGAQRAREP